MKTSKLSWYILDNDYTDFLKRYDDKVVHNDYNNGIKPYVGIVININDFNYYVPISSPKEKHNKYYKESGINKMLNYCCDFKKLEIACNQFTLSKNIINNTNNLSKSKNNP